MGLSTAHIFYIPVILMVGIFAGYFLGRQAAEKEAAELKKRRARRKAIREKAQQDEKEENSAETEASAI